MVKLQLFCTLIVRKLRIFSIQNSVNLCILLGLCEIIFISFKLFYFVKIIKFNNIKNLKDYKILSFYN